MNGVKKARQLCCNKCEKRIQKHEQYAGPNGFSIFCTGWDGENREIDNSYLEGPVDTCPLDKWSGLDPVGPTDPQEWQAWRREQEKERKRNNKKPQLKRMIGDIASNQEINANEQTAIAILVAAGVIPGWLADEISSEMGA